MTKPERRGFAGLTCPLCGNADDNVSVDLHDLGSFHCGQCGDEFARADVDDMIARWTPVLAWIDTAPLFASE